MGRLRILTPGIEPAVLELPTGVTTLGRREENPLCLPDGSISGRHCDLAEADGQLTILDLGSTNGTYVNGERTEQGTVAAGGTFKLGNIEVRYEVDEPVAKAAPPSAGVRVGPPGGAAKPSSGVRVGPPAGAAKLSSGVRHEPEAAPAVVPVADFTPRPPPMLPGGKPCTRHPGLPTLYICKKCRELACEKCAPAAEVGGKTQHFCPVCRSVCLTLAQKEVLNSQMLAREGQTFMQRLPGVFKYPFSQNGLMFLILGTIVFVALDFAARFSTMIAVAGVGYLFAYMQKIVRSSAEAENELPGFPEVGEWRSELLQPFLLLAWTFVVSFGPAFGYMIYHTFTDTEMSLPILFPLFALGFLYFPMALLAVAMSGSAAAVNPLVVLPAISRLNLEYVGATMVFFGLVTARYLGETLLRAAVPIPVLPTILSGFLALYFLACEMRLLGLIYYAHRKKLGWFSY